MPSTTSSSVLRNFASSTVITPSLPTFFIASAMKRPISASPLAEIVPTWAISSFEVTFLEFFWRSATMVSTARSTPRLRSIGFMPAATALAPSLTIACASTVAVVVPSPAWSEVFEATSRPICAPMFSNLSSSSISLATATPSLVMRGAPNDLSSITLRPLGPSVTRTAWVSVSMPCNILSRASTENFTSLADISVFLFVRPHSCDDYWSSPDDDVLSIRCFLGLRGARFTVSSRTRIWRAQSGGLLLGIGLDQHPHDVALFHDEVLNAIDFDLGARPFAEQDAISDLDVDGDELAALVAAAGSNGDDLALLRLLLGGVGNDDATSGLRLGVDSLDDNAVVKRSEFHSCPPTVSSKSLAELEGRSLFRKLFAAGPDIPGPLRSDGLIEYLNGLRLSMRGRTPQAARGRGRGRVLMAHASECKLYLEYYCLPTAPGLPLYKTETSVRRRFLGSSRTSRCLPVLGYVGCRT